MAGMKARAAVVTKVRQVMDICLTELQATSHSREYGAEPLAITAGIADGHLPLHFPLM
ncbi:hypothetical protein D3C79_1083790 [compost metagenome]